LKSPTLLLSKGAIVPFRRITIHEAKRRFIAGLPVVLCPCKCYPGGPFAVHMTIFPEKWIDNQRFWHEQGVHPAHYAYLALEAWDTMYVEWSNYNACHETGNYAHYYVESE
jgi:hypothetical protein